MQPKSNELVYVQIANSIKMQIIAGVLKADEKLMSVREYSMLEVVNPNTVAKAYNELEKEGYIYTLRGKGSFVADRKESVDKIREELKDELNSVIQKLLEAKMTKEEIISLINKY